jgi:hypothetical protein
MRRIAAAGLLAVAVVAPASATSATPSITLADRAPVVVHGTGFAARERVLVTLRSGFARAEKHARATYRGSFVVRFDAIMLTPCEGAAVVAAGARGHVARLKLRLRECPEPIIDP